VETTVGVVPCVSAELTRGDLLGAFKARWGVGRMDYLVEPGLYALGTPDRSAPVLVTANYKLTFDALRSALPAVSAWILVLDTRGINVWCAAGKGTFGTDELVARVSAAQLDQVVEHRRLVVPQLGAPGVAAHEVKARTGFKVKYGPIQASDLPAYLGAGMKASPDMRLKAFPARERAVLIPVELVSAVRTGLPIVAAALLLAGIGSGGYLHNVWVHGAPLAATLLSGLLAGAIATPLLLPWLPGRAFALKGLWPGLAAAALIAVAVQPHLGGVLSAFEPAAWFLIAAAVSSYLAMNFTGSSTYTSLSGVRREMRVAVPLQIGAAVLGIALWIAGRVVV